MLDFDKVKLRQIYSFLEVLLNLESRELGYFESAYRKNAENFQETQLFLEGLNLIQILNRNVVCTSALLNFLESVSTSKNFEEETKRLITKSIFEGNRDVSQQYLRYINRFQMVNGEYVYRPTNQDNIKFSGVRNLLMELEVVLLDRDRDVYIFSGKLLNNIYEDNIPISPALFRKLQRDKEELGLLAELLVLSDEEKRLSTFPELCKRIRHISKFVVNAGYDIDSFDGTYTSNGEPVKRFIEVKAVSLDNVRFFWSANELQKAEKFGTQYWLYLVPYKNKREFESSLIQRISDPYNVLFLNTTEWKSQVELFSFKRNI
jgi:hypothetical protein